jgi:hypothetical protein
MGFGGDNTDVSAEVLVSTMITQLMAASCTKHSGVTRTIVRTFSGLALFEQNLSAWANHHIF